MQRQGLDGVFCSLLLLFPLQGKIPSLNAQEECAGTKGVGCPPKKPRTPPQKKKQAKVGPPPLSFLRPTRRPVSRAGRVKGMPYGDLERAVLLRHRLGADLREVGPALRLGEAHRAGPLARDQPLDVPAAAPNSIQRRRRSAPCGTISTSYRTGGTKITRWVELSHHNPERDGVGGSDSDASCAVRKSDVEAIVLLLELVRAVREQRVDATCVAKHEHATD